MAYKFAVLMLMLDKCYQCFSVFQNIVILMKEW